MNSDDAAFADPLGTEATKLLEVWDDVTERLTEEQKRKLDSLCDFFAPEIAKTDGRLARSSMRVLCKHLETAEIPHSPEFLKAFRFVNWPLPFRPVEPEPR